nr:Transposon Tf2-12 polyprotein [Ipomoea batatas]
MGEAVDQVRAVADQGSGAVRFWLDLGAIISAIGRLSDGCCACEAVQRMCGAHEGDSRFRYVAADCREKAESSTVRTGFVSELERCWPSAWLTVELVPKLPPKGVIAHQRSGIHGHTADNTEATGGGKGAENRDEAEISKLFEGTGSVTGDVDVDVKDLWARVKQLEALVHALQEAARDDIETLREENDAFKQDVTLLKKVVASEHKAVPSRNSEKVAMTSMYLSGDAKLWWLTCVAVDASAGRERIESWERLKKELKLQFLPGNASWIAREALMRLSQTGTLRDYVKDLVAYVSHTKHE